VNEPRRMSDWFDPDRLAEAQSLVERILAERGDMETFMVSGTVRPASIRYVANVATKDVKMVRLRGVRWLWAKIRRRPTWYLTMPREAVQWRADGSSVVTGD